MTYLRTRPPVEELEKLYQSYASNPGSHMALPKTVDQIRQSGLRRDEFMDDVIKYTGVPKGAVLDIGCGWGAFLMNCRDHGYAVQGVEICRQMADFGNSILGVPIQSKQVEDCGFGDERFRVVTMIHSLEHLPNPRGALDCIHRMLEPEGFVCGIVPNFGSFCSTSMGDAWNWLDPIVHYSQFTPQTLTKFLWSAGFDTHRLYTTTGDYNQKELEQQILRHNPRMSPEMMKQQIKTLGENKQGEEIRFYAKRI